ncbi:hypothetical protein [Curtobacterium sp. NPDC088465]|uniref:hypothetical protein n=1 Tax=Curtobacterium sp. NPDC088465 TaxID=3363967 RepID=UPI0038188EC1
MDVDWMGALLGAVVGAFLTAGLGYVAYVFERNKVEKAAINELVRELSERRAFAIAEPRLIPGAAAGQYFKQLNSSVLLVRERIRETRAKLVRHSQAQEALTSMIQACNRYLERSAGDPPRYWFLAAELRDELHARLRKTGLNDAAEVVRPGDLAFSG